MRRETQNPGNATGIDAALAPLLADPDRAAILLDLDGTLAPIVSRPGDASIATTARASLVTVAERYALTAVVTGRRAVVARSIVGLDGIAYAGNHGFEVLAPGARRAVPVGALRGHGEEAPRFGRDLDGAELEAAGIQIEDKGPIVALHWRQAEDEAAAEELIERIGAAAEAQGLFTHAGRKVLELRPPVAIDKGFAVAGLLSGTAVRNALYAGDDRTDLDAFRELERRRDAGELDAIIRVGVRSEEGPAEIAERSDLVVAGPSGMGPLLAALAR
ncbi:MAG: trehalose-phosphatase [Actinomycetota bacterium]|nr:trehalose-phosphatase [Actinomycetota bacterium]